MERKTIYIMCGSVIGVLLIIIVGLWLVSNMGPRYYEYSEVESMIQKATDKYYRDNPIYLPTDDGRYNLSYSALVSDGYIKPLDDLVENGEVCSANITVIKKGESFTYIPYLNCGDEYTTNELANKILKDNPVVTEGNGLYKVGDNSYVFKGKVTNNYVAFGSYEKKNETIYYLWRVMGIENGKVRMRAVTNLKKKTEWDNRFNTTEENYWGYNDFDLSILSEYLRNLETPGEYLSENELAKIEPQNLCVGTRDLEDDISKGAVECGKMSKEQFQFGTMLPYDYMSASLDSECTTASNKACSNFNYLVIKEPNSEWLMVSNGKNNYEAISFEGNKFVIDKTKYKKYIYPVITLNEFSFFGSGSGTEEDPYMIK